MLVIHGLSGADTVHVATLHGIGKATFIKYQRLDVSHSLNMVLIRPTKSVEAEATNFICAAYVRQQDRILLWQNAGYRPKRWHSNRKSGASSLKLCLLRPTRRIHRWPLSTSHNHWQQTCSSKMYTEDKCKRVWKAAIQESLPNMNPTRYGWKHILQPRTVSSSRLSAHL